MGRTADEARIVRRLKRLPAQRTALQLALQPYRDEEGRFDRGLWADGGLSAAGAETLMGLYRVRNGLQHDSPGVGADEVHAQVEALLKAMPGLLRSFVAWLRSHDVEVLS